MTFSWGRCLSVAGGDVPLHCVRVGTDLQCVEIVQVPRDVVLGVLAIVGQATKEKHLFVKVSIRDSSSMSD